ncbi:MAG TPA: porin [Sphingomicrobium sp.]
MLKIAKRREAKLVAAFAAAGLVLTPAFATGTSAKKRPPAVSLSFDPISSFTPANADPRLAAALAGKGLALTDFKFTPAPAKGRPAQIRVAIRARVGSPAKATDAIAATSAVSALTPTSYNLGVAVGWKRFAIAGDVTRVKDANPALGGRESAVVGVSYSLNNRLSTRVAVGADRPEGQPVPALRHGDNYSLDVGGSYSLSHQIAVTGGVRYNVERDRLSALHDERRDSQAVYVGTAFKF